MVLSRSKWTSSRNGRAGRPLRASGMLGIALHYPASGNVSFGRLSQAAVAAKLRGWRNYHINGNGWADIGYNFAIDQKGRVWDLTSWNVGAHAGSVGNTRYVGILLVLGNNEQPSSAMIRAIKGFRTKTVLKRYPRATRIKGHQQVPGNSTACPGRPVMALIRSGKLAGKPKATKKSTKTAGKAIRPTIYEVTAGDLNARSGPSSSYPIKGSHKKGHQVTYIRQSGKWLMSTGGWWRHGGFMKKAIKEDRTAGKAIEPTVYEVADTYLSAYSGPGTDFPVMGKHKRGNRVTFIRQSGDWVMSTGGWWRHAKHMKKIQGK